MSDETALSSQTQPTQIDSAHTKKPFLTSTVSSEGNSAQAINQNDSLAQISGALGGIILLILLGAWLFKTFVFGRNPLAKQQLINVKGRCTLGGKERVVVVEVNDEYLVLGVTSQSVNLLHQYPAPQENDVVNFASEPLTFQSIFKKKQDAANTAVPEKQ
ncbi:flagellar biosynthetic protein FliO [Providencia alcalifaciens]|uniref:flagellar biosynthetic protein FliO n=1 Tax=Providencia alcalifaciens TaxID=126385 RepID=UPI0012B67948|nr:flagellar biosynthetic protein FliO [Providencia alcalifaciens]MTC40065.1 flagellar biosynthetic protein FliO [Providencia alcalifaciens]